MYNQVQKLHATGNYTLDFLTADFCRKQYSRIGKRYLLEIKGSSVSLRKVTRTTL